MVSTGLGREGRRQHPEVRRQHGEDPGAVEHEAPESSWEDFNCEDIRHLSICLPASIDECNRAKYKESDANNL